MINPRDEESGKGDFLPDLCTVQAVFFLILVGELLAFAMVIINRGVENFSWLFFGSVSFLVQWIILASAASICPLRPWFKRQNGIVAGSVSFTIVMTLTLIFTVIGSWVEGDRALDSKLMNNMLIAAIFAGLVLRYFYLQQQLHNREQAELRSRIQALQSRIRPHFLFNSMNSIASLIMIDPEAAEKMVVDLSQLFRSSLSNLALVPIKDEISLCEKFISIEQIRLGDRLQVNWRVDLAERNPPIPSLALQPIIENAIYHGVQPLRDGGQVDVTIHLVGAEVNITVQNPLDKDARDAHKSASNGVALSNIRYRLDAHFGSRAKLQVEEGGTTFKVTMNYPVLSKD